MSDDSAKPGSKKPATSTPKSPPTTSPPASQPPTDADAPVVLAQPAKWRTVLLAIIAFVAVVFALKSAQVVVVPLTLAIVISILLSPVVLWLGRLGIPTALGAAVVVGSIVAVTVTGVYYLSYPAAEWMRELPVTAYEIEWKLRDLKEPIEQVTEASKQVEEMATGNGDDASPTVTVRQQSYAEMLLSSTRAVIASAAVVIVLVYMLLAAGDIFLHKLVKVQSNLSKKKLAVEAVQQIKHDVATHLFTITAINIGLGLCVAGSSFLLGMPNPLLWGLMAAALNFIPYFGSIIGVIIMALVAFATFDDISRVVLPPLVYALFTAIEGYVVTPMILGARLSLNPVVIVVGLVFWTWLWGIPGAILTVPLLVIIKALCDRTTGLQAIGEFLGK